MLLSGCWRSDEEIKSNQNTWTEALEYHGLIPPHNPEDDVISPLFVQSLINSFRYNRIEVSSILTSMISQGINPNLIIHSLNSMINENNFNKINEIIQRINEYTTNINEQNQPVHSLDIGRHNLRNFISCDFTSAEKNSAIQCLNNSWPFIQSNSDQLNVVNKVVSSINQGLQLLLFVQGKAGTGKSFLIHHIRNIFIAKSIPFLTCASTGIAASLIDGQTAHSAFSIFSDSNDNSISGVRIQSQRGVALSKIKFLIIDEITMLSKSALECIEHSLKTLALATRKPNANNPFGGCSILLFGDMSQVPAVSNQNDDLLEARYQFNNISCWDHFQIYSLERVVRQDPDQVQLLSILDQIRNYRENTILSLELLDALKSRFLVNIRLSEQFDIVDDFVGNDDPEGMVICYKNSEANEYNNRILHKRARDNEIIIVNASYYTNVKSAYIANPSSNNNIEAQREIYSTRISHDSEIRILSRAFVLKKTRCIVPRSLAICIGARIMLLKNINQKEKLINGARGTIVDFKITNDVVEGIEIKFDQIDEPKIILKQEVHSYQFYEGRIIRIFQFPIKLCWACTAHKAQGQTLKKVAISIRDVAFAHGSFYVALSRVKRMEDIMLFGREEWPEGGPKFHVNEYIQNNEIANQENALPF